MLEKQVSLSLHKGCLGTEKYSQKEEEKRRQQQEYIDMVKKADGFRATK